MNANGKLLGTIDNPEQRGHRVSIPLAVLVLGGAAVGTYVGLRIGGGKGAAVGALVGAFIGTLAAGMLNEFEIIHHPNGKVEARAKQAR